MKKLLCFLFLFFCVGFLSCDDKEIYGNVIQSTEFVLYEECAWNADLAEEKVYWANNSEDFKKLVHCINISDLTEINFEKYTLVSVRGVETSGALVENVILTQTDKNKYTLNVIIERYATTVITPWQVALLVPKLNNKIDIKFIKDYTY